VRRPVDLFFLARGVLVPSASEASGEAPRRHEVLRRRDDAADHAGELADLNVLEPEQSKAPVILVLRGRRRELRALDCGVNLFFFSLRVKAKGVVKSGDRLGRGPRLAGGEGAQESSKELVERTVLLGEPRREGLRYRHRPSYLE